MFLGTLPLTGGATRADGKPVARDLDRLRLCSDFVNAATSAWCAPEVKLRMLYYRRRYPAYYGDFPLWKLS